MAIAAHSLLPTKSTAVATMVEAEATATVSDDESTMPDPPSQFSVDDSLSKELLKLSFQERVAIQEEIHGVRCLAMEETPELVESSLRAFDKLLMAKKHQLDEQVRKENEEQQRKERETKQSDPQWENLLPKKPKTHLLRNVRSSSGASTSSNSDRGCYLNDPAVRLRFLRCDRFDPAKAVQRLIKFLELAAELFGDFVADRPLRVTDFGNRREEVALQNSRNQYLPFRDRSGRRVFVGVGTCDFDLDYDLRYKIMLYLHWMASQDAETQQKGVVICAWPTNEERAESSNSDGGKHASSSLSWEQSLRPQMNQRLRALQKKLTDAMPLRVTSYLCFFPDTPFFKALSAMYYIGMDSKSRSLYRVHYGETIELRYALSSYGISEQLLPLSNTGTVKTANHSRWINALRSQLVREDKRLRKQRLSSGSETTSDEDEDTPTIESVDCPGSRDVIFRKGPTYKNNPGNMFFRELLEETHEQHSTASRKEKCRITWRIVREIERHNGRFLDWSQKKDTWIVSRDREKIRTKVAACYKQYNRNVLAYQQQQKQAAEKARLAREKSSQRSLCAPSKFPKAMVDSFVDGHHPLDATLPTNLKRVNRSILEHTCDVFAPSSKRRKVLSSLFCGYNSSSSCSSDSSTCGF